MLTGRQRGKAGDGNRAVGNDLKTIIRVHRWQVDERRRDLGVLLQREGEVLDARDRLEAERRAEQEIAAQDAAGAGFAYAGYHTRYMQRREALAGLLAQVQAEIETAKQALADAYQDLKTFEITQRNRDERERQEQERRETAVLDEIGLNHYRRRQARDAAAAADPNAAQEGGGDGGASLS